MSKRNPSDSKEKNAFGALICRGLVLSSRFDIDTFASLSLYETGVLSFSRDGALRRSAYRSEVREVSWLHPIRRASVLVRR